MPPIRVSPRTCPVLRRDQLAHGPLRRPIQTHPRKHRLRVRILQRVRQPNRQLRRYIPQPNRVQPRSQHCFHHIAKFTYDPLRSPPAQQLAHLCRHALPRHQPQAVLPLPRCPRRALLQREPVHRRKTQRPQDPQRILVKPRPCLTHAADHAALQILSPAKAVAQPLLRAVRHRVHGKIPPRQIALHLAHEFHRVRPPVVGVFPVHAVRRHLIRLPARDHRQRAVHNTRLDHAQPRKRRPHLFRRRVRA